MPYGPPTLCYCTTRSLNYALKDCFAVFAAESLPTTVQLINSNFTVSPFNESEASGAREGLYRKVLSPFVRSECDEVGLHAKYFEQNGCVRLAKP